MFKLLNFYEVRMKSYIYQEKCVYGTFSDFHWQFECVSIVFCLQTIWQFDLTSDVVVMQIGSISHILACYHYNTPPSSLWCTFRSKHAVPLDQSMVSSYFRCLEINDNTLMESKLTANVSKISHVLVWDKMHNAHDTIRHICRWNIRRTKYNFKLLKQESF